jgi:hypothetical protein
MLHGVDVDVLAWRWADCRLGTRRWGLTSGPRTTFSFLPLFISLSLFLFSLSRSLTPLRCPIILPPLLLTGFPSYITLIPKNEGPITTSYYRPISLLNCPLKLLTKVLANRLQKVIKKLIHINQYDLSRARPSKIAWHGHQNISISVISPRRIW